MNFSNPFFPRHAFLFKGGVPNAPALQAPPAPPASPSAIEVTQAKLDAKRQAKDKTGFSSTVLAGGGAFAQVPGAQPGGKNTVLGGG